MGDRPRILLALSLSALLLYACAPPGRATAPPTATAAARSAAAVTSVPLVVGPVKWNTQDPNANTNGNGRLVAAMLKPLPVAELRGRAEVALPVALRKAPWDHYGKALRIRGQVSEAHDLPRGGQVARDLGAEQVGELILVAEDGLRLSYAHLGSIGQVRPGQKVDVFGYVVGLVDVDDGSGGKTAVPHIVGKEIGSL